ncbi:hypothetical protein DW831_20375 [Bacteroides uniformis]|uniref:Uncharacterized protein n=1 Tax=Bacteroides uniformis TaxID=820 RepID=A0A414BAF2_BACUN|nr:hypothetical protein DW831_20375 [Bacteroides uniformis]
MALFLILSKSNSSFIKKTVLAKLILYSLLTQFNLHPPNRYLLALNSTNDANRNYFFGLESFFFSVCSIIVPIGVGGFWYGLPDFIGTI